MIEDRDIDLTIEHKFYVHPRQINKHYESAKRKIVTGNFSSDKRAYFDIDAFEGERLSRRLSIPWVKKESSIQHTDGAFKQYKSAHHADDSLSNDFGCTVRSTSSNTILFIGPNGNQHMQEEVMEEVFMESVGYIPFTAVTRCLNCGTWVIAPHNIIPMICDKCVDESRYNLPWKRIRIGR